MSHGNKWNHDIPEGAGTGMGRIKSPVGHLLPLSLMQAYLTPSVRKPEQWRASQQPNQGRCTEKKVLLHRTMGCRKEMILSVVQTKSK